MEEEEGEGRGLQVQGWDGDGLHFVLIHGVCHGAWCWYKLRCLLESRGHRVSALDLAGAGIHPADPDYIVSIDDYDKPLFDLLSALPDGDQVVLVGSSAGGMSVTHAIHEFSNKISLAIYIGATMLRSGFSSKQDFEDGDPDLREFGDIHEFNFRLGHDYGPTSVSVRKEFQRELMYHLSPMEDSVLASMLLRPGPAHALSTARFNGENKNIDSVKRVYIKTLYDRCLKPDQQERMVRRWPPTRLLSIKSDHSPFFSAPTKLFDLLMVALYSIRRL